MTAAFRGGATRRSLFNKSLPGVADGRAQRYDDHRPAESDSFGEFGFARADAARPALRVVDNVDLVDEKHVGDLVSNSAIGGG